MAVLERDEGKIFYAVSGEGEALLLLRGLGRSSRYWLGFDKLMAHHFKVITIDLRGTGRSTEPMHWTDSIDTLADDCLAVLDELGVKKFHIYGFSFGGMVATAIASKVPTRVSSLAIAGSSSADGHGFRIHPSVVPKLLLALKQGRFQDVLLETVVPRVILRSRGPEIQASWEEILRLEGFPLATTLKQLRLSMTHTIKGKLDKGKYPVMFLHGSLDAFTPMQNSLRMQRLIARAKLQIIKGAGHELALGFEHELSRILREFARTANRAS